MGTQAGPGKIGRPGRDAGAEPAGGRAVARAAQELGESEPTYDRRRPRYGGRQADEARRLKELEAENARLKRLVAELALGEPMRREVVRGKS